MIYPGPRRSFFCLILFCLFSGGLQAQKVYVRYRIQSDTVYKKEIGVNLTDLVKNAFVPNKLELTSFYPYDFTYKKLRNDKRYFMRYGISLNYAHNFQFTDDRRSDVFRFALKIGREKHYKIHDNFYFIRGGDFRMGMENRIFSDTDPSLVTVFMGYAFTCGLEYRFMERFRLSSELALMATLLTSSANFPGAAQISTFGNTVSAGIETEIMVPTFIILAYAF